MSIFSLLTEKPWTAEQARIDNIHAGNTFAIQSPKVGLWVFVTVATVLFLLLVMAYGMRMGNEEWRPAPQLSLLWFNTIMLVLSSASMQWAAVNVRQRKLLNVQRGMSAAGIFSFAFLAGQLLAWQQLDSIPVFDVTNAAIAFFFLITGLHALHMLGGMLVWGRTASRIKHDVDLVPMRLSVELCAVYWHFLLAVWLVLFGLLFSGNDSLEFLLAICGLR